MEECIICFEERNEFMFYQCTHKVCKQCFPKIQSCPICQTPNDLIIEVYMPVENTTRYRFNTYNLVRCVGSCLLIFGLSIYFYNHT